MLCTTITVLAVQACASEFISFVSSDAGNHCSDGSRRHLDGEDVLWSLTALGFEHYADTLQVGHNRGFMHFNYRILDLWNVSHHHSILLIFLMMPITRFICEAGELARRLKLSCKKLRIPHLNFQELLLCGQRNMGQPHRAVSNRHRLCPV